MDVLIRNYGICVGAFIAAFALVWWRVSARGYVSIYDAIIEFKYAAIAHHLCSKYTGPRTNDYAEVARDNYGTIE